MLQPIENTSLDKSAASSDLSKAAPARWRPVHSAVESTREFFRFCAGHRLWLACMVVFLTVWTVELYTVQEVTLVYPNDTTEAPRFAFWAPKIRLVLDVLFLSALTFWLRRRWLFVVLGGSFVAYLILVTYFHYFLRPLTLTTIFANWREGAQLGGFAWGLFPKKAASLLLLALGVKLGALFLSRGASLPRNCARLGGMVLTTAYVVLLFVADVYDPLYFIQTTRSVGRLGEIRGYLGPWFAEWYYLQDQQIFDRAVALRKIPYDRLTPHEGNIPIHKHLVIVQAESFDYNILGYRANGQEVTPFLNHLRTVSMFYRIRAVHPNGSSDADFAALNGVRGSDHENPYIIRGYPYVNTTPQVLARCGFDVASFHGKSGEFYSRRQAFEQMGFAEINFQEELESKFGLAADSWGVKDRDVLSLSAQQLRAAKSPTCHFIITLTTHTPYTNLPNEREIYPNPRNSTQHFINNMRYLDNCLRDYITSLGKGATVMLYADHPTEEGDGDFKPDRVEGRQYIPCFIYDTDQDLSKLQKTRNDPAATDGTWNLVDLINYLRAQAERSPQADQNPADEKQPAGPEVQPAAAER